MSFYEYIIRFVNQEANDPMSRLANTIHDDNAFPKKSSDFEEISRYLESVVDYGKLLTVFDDAWYNYQFEIE